MTAGPALSPVPDPAPSLAALFGVCFKIGILSFGGGLSGWIHREFVELRRWVTDEDFLNRLGFAQVLPGANVVNLVIALGDDLRGLPGALACFCGFLVGPFFGVLGMLAAFRRLQGLTYTDAVLEGVTFAAIALIAAVCIANAARIRKSPTRLGMAAAIGVGVGVFQLPLVPTVLCVAPISVLLSWRQV